MIFVRKKNLNRLVLLFALFGIGFSLGRIRNNNLIELKNKLDNRLLENYESKFCPKKIPNLKSNSILIIGHAYGSHEKSEKRGNLAIAPKVYNFYLRNKHNIKAIIFSGDVLKEPNIKKWNDFNASFDKDFKKYISPGNHDVGVGDSALRDVFNQVIQKNQNQKKFPFKVYLNDSLFIIADTSAKENPLKEIFSIIDQETKSKNIYIIMHHVMTKGLSFAENYKGVHKPLEDNIFKKKFKANNNKKIFFIYGDGGAFQHKPRIACLKLANSLHMVSGIGEVSGDTIFVVKEDDIYTMEI